MFVRKNFTFREIIKFSGFHYAWLLIWALIATAVYHKSGLDWLAIPWLPVSVIGTAVAFYIGFKNNQAYDRLWEARKIWGGIVNDSRAWGAAIKGFVTDQFTDENISDRELHSIKKRLIYRHVAWLYALRSQLLIPTEWEHISQGRFVGKLAEKRRKESGVGLLADEITMNELDLFLPKDEFERLISYKNTATQIIDQQSQDLMHLRKQDLIDDFRHMELQKLLTTFYTHQGKAERIKKFPLPRQYANMSIIFVGIFIALLPFAMAGEFGKMGHFGIWWSIPFTALISWVYLMMELVGDYSENPFEGTGNDIPMYALSRTIEIDLREMLGETDLPPGIKPINGVLM